MFRTGFSSEVVLTLGKIWIRQNILDGVVSLATVTGCAHLSPPPFTKPVSPVSLGEDLVQTKCSLGLPREVDKAYYHFVGHWYGGTGYKFGQINISASLSLLEFTVLAPTFSKTALIATKLVWVTKMTTFFLYWMLGSGCVRLQTVPIRTTRPAIDHYPQSNNRSVEFCTVLELFCFSRSQNEFC